MTSFDWPPVLVNLPESVWTLDDAGVPRTRIRLAGCALDVAGLKVTDGPDGIQSAVDDPDGEKLLLDLYDPEEPWQTWSGFGAEYALYATPSRDQDAPVAVDEEVSRAAWAGFAPDMEELDRKLTTVVVNGHCALHLDARLVEGPGQEFVAYPEDRAALAALAGWEGPFPTVDIEGRGYVVFAYPHGD